MKSPEEPVPIYYRSCGRVLEDALFLTPMIGEHGAITNREYHEAFSVSHKTAHLELTLLENKKLVKSEGAGRSTRYILVPQAG